MKTQEFKIAQKLEFGQGDKKDEQKIEDELEKLRAKQLKRGPQAKMVTSVTNGETDQS